MRPELNRALAACERLGQDRPQEVLGLLADAEQPLPALEESLVLAARGLLAERQGDLEQAMQSFERVFELAVPLPELLRASAWFFRRHGRSLEANECFSLLSGIDPEAIGELAAGFGPTEQVRYAPRVVPAFMRSRPPELYALAPVKRAMTEALGGDAAAFSFAQMAGLQPGWDVRDLSIASLKEFAESRNLRYEEIAAPREVRVPPAPVFGAADGVGETVTSRALFACVIPDATVSSKSNFVIADDVALLDYQGDELDHVPIDLQVDPILFDRQGPNATFLLAAVAEDGERVPRALSLAGINSHAFGHLLVEFLPRLFATLGEPGFESVPIIIDEQMPRQHREAIQFFAGPEHPILVLPPTDAVRVKELWTCSMITNISLAPAAGSGDDVPLLAVDGEAFAALIAKVEHKLEEIEPAAGRRIYLTRKDTQLRKLVNREEVETWFRAREFEVVDLEQLSFAEQLALVRGADVIVGPDGSSMQMSFFAGRGTKIGILNNPYLEDHRFYRVACEALRQRLLILTGDVVTEHPGYWKFSDYRIEPTALPLFLDALTEDPDERPLPVGTVGAPSRSGTEPKVSVLLQTYNHEGYIERAIESVLAQDTPFPIELIVSDDLSEDGTRQRVSRYADAHPDLIRPLFPGEHLGMNPLFRRALSLAEGNYLAFLDGDDYWTAPDKLQRQVALLEARSELTGCFHDALVLSEEGTHPPRRYVGTPRKDEYGIEDLLRLCHPPTLSVLVRRAEVDRVPEWAFDLAWADWLIWILATRAGPFGFIDEAMGVYRTHPGGYFSSQDRSSQLEEDLRLYERLRDALPEHRELIERCITGRACELAVEETGIPFDAPVVVVGEYDDLPMFFNGRTARFANAGSDRSDPTSAASLSAEIDRRCAEGSKLMTPQWSSRVRARPPGGDRCYVVVPRDVKEQTSAADADPSGLQPGGSRVWSDGRCEIYEWSRVAQPPEVTADAQEAVPRWFEIVDVWRPDPPDARARGRIERPRNGEVVDISNALVVGWTLGEQRAATEVELEYDGEVVATIPVSVERPDVAEVFPGRDRARTAGFKREADLRGAVRQDCVELNVHAVLADHTHVHIGRIRGRMIDQRKAPSAESRSNSRASTTSESR